MDISVTGEAKQTIDDGITLAEQYNDFAIQNHRHYTESANILKQIKGKLKMLDETRKAITKPIDDAKKKVMALFKEPQDALKNVEENIKSAIIDFQDNNEDAEKIAGIKRVKTWKYKVVNIDKVPRKYLTVDDKLLSGLAKSSKGVLKIPGIEIYESSTISAESE